MKVQQQTIDVVLIGGLGLCTLLAVFSQPPDFWLTADQQGDRFVEQEKFPQAAEVYADPVRQGVAYYRAAQFEEAAATFARVDDAPAAFNRGNALIMLGKYDEAIQSFDRALQFRPDWLEAEQNRAIAVARRDRLQPPEDDDGGTGGQLEADEIVFDDRAKNSSEQQEIEVGAGDKMSDDELRSLWLQRVQTKPGDFLRVKFSYQLARRDKESSK